MKELSFYRVWNRADSYRTTATTSTFSQTQQSLGRPVRSARNCSLQR
jgi:hypothetical protein